MIAYQTDDSRVGVATPPRIVSPQAVARSEAFGDFKADLLVDDLVVHCLGGRDGERITLHADDQLHSLRVLLAFAEEQSAVAAIDRPEPSLTEVLSRWPDVRQALRSDRLAAFEHNVTTAVVDRFNNPAAG